jgi:NDP-sugar pyrophosphorylase family protein
MKAVILSGGKGERLRPFTYEIPKILIPINKRTLLDYSIDLYYKHKIFEIWLSVGYKGNDVIDKFPLPHFFEKKPLGTGGWLYYTIADKDYWSKEDFFVNNGDNLFNINLDEMMEVHKKNGAVVTIACTRVKDVREYGSVHITGEKINSFEEKKKSRIKKPGWINGGFYIMSPKIFDYLIESGKKFPESISLEKDIFPLIAKKGELFAYKSDAQWFDTGTIERYDEVIKEWKGIS